MVPRNDDQAVELLLPIDFISKACDRLKQTCVAMVRIRSTQVGAAELLNMAVVLRRDFPLQFADEAEDLIPILQLRARPGDELAAVLRDLTTMHAGATQQLGRCAVDLELLRQGENSPLELRVMGEELSSVATALHRHLSLVTAVLLPIARLRFTDGDLAALRQGLAARRGIALPHSEN